MPTPSRSRQLTAVVGRSRNANPQSATGPVLVEPNSVKEGNAILRFQGGCRFRQHWRARNETEPSKDACRQSSHGPGKMEVVAASLQRTCRRRMADIPTTWVICNVELLPLATAAWRDRDDRLLSKWIPSATERKSPYTLMLDESSVHASCTPYLAYCCHRALRRKIPSSLA